MQAIAHGAVVVLLAASFAVGQPLTLRAAVDEALRRNHALLAQRRDIDAAQADVTTARLFPSNPQLTVNGDMLPTAGGFSPDSKMYGASVAVPIELGGKRDARVAVAERAREATAATVDDAARQLTGQVRDAFIDALRAQAQVGYAVATAQSLDSVVTLNEMRLAAHDIATTELDRSRIAAERAHLDVADARVSLTTSLATLQTAMGRDVIDTALAIDGVLDSLPESPAPSLEAAKTIARDHRAVLAAARAQIDAEQENATLQDANATVDLSVSADFSRQQGTTFYGSTLSVPLPLFNRNQGDREKAAVRVARAQEALRAVEQRVDADTEVAYREYTARLAIVAHMRAAVLPRVEDVRRSVEYAYHGGHTSILDLLDAERTYRDTMKDYTDALAQMQKSANALRTAMGI